MLRIITLLLFFISQPSMATATPPVPSINYITGVWSGTSTTTTSVSGLFTTKPYTVPLQCEFPANTDSLTNGTLLCVVNYNTSDTHTGSYSFTSKLNRQMHWTIDKVVSYIDKIITEELMVYANLHKSVGIDTSTIAVNFLYHVPTPQFNDT